MLADAHIKTKARDRRRTGTSTSLDYAELEGEMTGHPWITYNKGRLGCGYDDYLELRAGTESSPSTLSWLAVSSEQARRSAAVSRTSHPTNSLVAEELGELYEAFRRETSKSKRPRPGGLLLHAGPRVAVGRQHRPTATAEEIADERHHPARKDGPDEYLPAAVDSDVRERGRTGEATTSKLPLRILNTLV